MLREYEDIIMVGPVWGGVEVVFRESSGRVTTRWVPTLTGDKPPPPCQYTGLEDLIDVIVENCSNEREEL
jgi:hypothetical protein